MKKLTALSMVFLMLFSTASILAFNVQPVRAHSGDVFSAWATVTPAMNGIISPGEWDDADSLTVNVIGANGEPHSLTLYIKNDGTYLYLAVVVDDEYSTELEIDFLNFYFDNNNNGVTEIGDDGLAIRFDGRYKDDIYNPTGIPGWSYTDVSGGGTNDLIGWITHTNPVPNGMGTYTAEYRHPLDSADDAHDFSLSAGDTVGFEFNLAEVGGYFHWPSDAASRYADIIIALPPPPTMIEDFSYVSDWSLKSKAGVASGQYGLYSGADLWIECNDAGNEYASFKRGVDPAIDPNKYPSLAVSFFTSPNTMFKVYVKDSAGNVKLVLSVANQLAWTTKTVNLKSYTTNTITEIWILVTDEPDSTSEWQAHVFIRSILVSGYGWQEPFSNVSRWKFGSAYRTSSYGLSSDGNVAKLWLKADDSGNEYVGYKSVVSINPNYYPYLKVRFKTSSNCVFRISIKDSAGRVYSILSASSSAWAVRTIDLKSYTSNTITEVWIYADDSPDSYAGGTIYANIDYMNVYGYGLTEYFKDPALWTLQSSGGVVSGEWGLDAAGDLWVRCNDAGNEYAGYRKTVSIDPNIYPYLSLKFRITSNALLEIRIKDSAGNVKLILSTSYPLFAKWTIAYILGLKVFTTKTITEISIYINDNPDSTATGQINAIIDYIQVQSQPP